MPLRLAWKRFLRGRLKTGNANIKKSLIAAGALALFSSAGAQAADIVTYQEQPVAAASAAPSQVNWNGLYIGGTIGGSWANANTALKEKMRDEDDNDKIINTKGKKKLNPDSFIGGLYAGYNFQPGFLSQSALKDVVFGIETDWLWNSGDAAGNKSYMDTAFGDGWELWTYRGKVRQKWNGATRLRAGYALGSEGRILPYLAGGVSYAQIQARFNHAEGVIKGKGTKEEWGGMASETKTRAGWNIGAGVDYIPPILSDHLVLRAEYRFTDFGNMTFNKMKNEDYAGKQTVKFNQNDFRVGVAYKF